MTDDLPDAFETDAFEESLREELRAHYVAFDGDRAQTMIDTATRADLLDARRSWNAPLAAAATVVLVSGGVALLAASGGGSDQPAGSGTPSATESTSVPAAPRTVDFEIRSTGRPESIRDGVSYYAGGPVLARGETLTVDTVTFKNPNADKGTIILAQGGKPVLTDNLETMSGLHARFNNVLVADDTHPFRLGVRCANADGRSCSSSVEVHGIITSRHSVTLPIPSDAPGTGAVSTSPRIDGPGLTIPPCIGCQVP